MFLSLRRTALLLITFFSAVSLLPSSAHSHQHRSYELVSPTDKGGNEIPWFGTDRHISELHVAPDGSAAAYGARDGFPGAASIQSGTYRPQYVSQRGEERWITRGVSPPFAPTGGTPAAGSGESYVAMLSEDLRRAVVRTNAFLTPEADALPDDVGMYLQDHSTFPATWILLSDPADPLPSASFAWGRIRFSAATPDLSHVVFTSERKLLPEGPDDMQRGLYEWSGGELRLAGVLPNDDPAVGAVAGTLLAGQLDSRSMPGINPISEDGSRLYFSVAGGFGGSALYLRQNNGTPSAETKVVSVDERPGEGLAVTGGALFLGASSDGSVAFFSSPHKLTEDATADGNLGRDLYRWDAEADPGERLTNLTTEDPDGGGVGVPPPSGSILHGAGEVAMSDDGSSLYFIATGDLAPGAEPGEKNLYLWRDGEGIRRVAVLDDADIAVGSWDRSSSIPHDRRYRAARGTGDGERLLFESRAPLTAHDNAGHRQVYLYDATANQITCVSCSPLSEPSTADAALFLEFEPPPGLASPPLSLPRNLSDDGARAFFETTERLVTEDTNGKRDVYEWDDGELKLVSDGQSPHDTRFLGASANGDDVFINTRARLSGWDEDNLADVYRATTGETFPEPPRPPDPCVGDECQAAGPEVPGDIRAGSAELAGEGNPQAVTLSARPLPNRAARRLSRGKPIAVRADVTGPPGRITAVARANLRRGMARAGRATAQVQEAGRVLIRGLRLRPRALRVLRQRGQLRVRVVVSYADERDGQRLNLRRPGRGGRR